MGAVAILGGGGLLMLLLALSGGGSSSAPPGPGPLPPPDVEPEPADEAELADITEDDLVPLVCEFFFGADTARSDEELARLLLDGAIPQHDFEGAIPTGTERDRVLKLAIAIMAAVRSGETTCDLPITIDDTPRAGGYYQIQSGDSPLGIMRKAYPWADGGQRVELARLVTAHPANGGGVIGQGLAVAPTYETTRNLIGPVIFSMFKRWRCSPRTSQQRFLSGSCYAVLYLPDITL